MSSLAHTLKELESLSLLGEAFPYEKLLSSTIVGISYMVDWRFVWSNERMHSIFGYFPGDFRGKTARFLYPCQDDYDEVLRRYDRRADNDDFTIERPLVRKDGSLIWCLMSAQRLHTASSSEASVWVVQDVTEQRNAVDVLKRTNQRLEQIIERRTLNLRRTNQALRLEVERRQALQFDLVASREKYRALFRHLPVGVLVTSRQGEIVEINQATQNLAAARSRIELMHLLNDSSRVLQPDGTTISLAKFVQQHSPSERRKIYRSALVWRSNSGTLRELSMIATALVGHELGAIFTFEDVTEIKRAREREHEQQQHLAHAARLSLTGQIASAMAHELGQPLNACQSYISGIRHRLGAELKDKPELLEAIDKIALHLDNASKIIGNVRGFVSRRKVDQKVLDLKTVLDHTLGLLAMHLKLNEAQLDVFVADEPLHVYANDVELQQVIVNLVVNALEAMADFPVPVRRLAVSIGAVSDKQVFIEVRDHGPGVSPELVEKLFDPYFTTKSSGLGMGLKICRNIVESGGGSLRFSNEENGAKFRVTLPRLISA